MFAVTVDGMHSLIKVAIEQQNAQYDKLQRGAAYGDGRRHKGGRMQRLAKDAQEFGAALGMLARLKYIVPASSDFEEMVEKVIKIPAGATVQYRRALAEAMARGFAQSVEKSGAAEGDS